MRYPVFIEYGNETTAYGMHIPDIPGAVTAGDTLEEAWSMAEEVCHIQLEELATAGETIPLPSPIEKYQDHPDYAGMSAALLDIDIAPYLGKTEKVNVTLPAFLIKRMDEYVAKRGLKSRSAFLAEAALSRLTACQFA